MLLSICIPSYNRFKIFVPDLKNLLKAKSDDFEVIVVDNCSTQDKSELLSIDDKRLHVIQRDTAVSGPYNVGDCLRYAKGEFAMLCLDKDRVIGEKLDLFIDELRKNKNDLCGGYCFQNFSNQTEEIKIVEDNALYEFGFLNKHPSGDFYKNSLLKECYEKFPDSDIADPFMFDLFLSYCAANGKMMLYQKPMVFLERPNDSKNIKSLSFHKSDNTLFFFPNNRIQEFLVYLRHLSQYSVPQEVKDAETKIIYGKTVGDVTFGYKNCSESEAVSNHYNFPRRQVSFAEMKEHKEKLEQAFIETNLTELSKAEREQMIRKADIKFRLKYVYKKVFRKI